MIHTLDIKIRGYHIDVFGHVNNARYLEFMEEARWAAFEKTIDLQSLAQKGYIFTVVNININYRKAAVMNDMLCIETWIKQFRNRSAVIHQTAKIKGSDTVVTDADVTFVLFDVKNLKTANLEGEVLELLKTA